MPIYAILMALAQASAPAGLRARPLTPLGWAFMLTSIISVTILTAWCFYRVLSRPQIAEHMHGPLDVDRHDAGT
jgi:hypothetical protein